MGTRIIDCRRAISIAATGGAQSPPAQTGPAVGEMAPDFSVPGVTRFGLLRDPVTLSSLRGNTVVLAFFFKARTKG
jgi:hypothetical protein